MEKIGLVLAGGGSKGSYQIGVWRALEELGVMKNIKGYSGTSIGALNAGLFVQGDLEAAEEMWRQVNKEQMMNLKINERDKTPLNIRFKDIRNRVNLSDIKIMERIRHFQEELDQEGISLFDKLKDIPVFGPHQELSRFAERIKNLNINGAYSREGLKKVMYNTADFDLIRKSDIPWYAGCLEIPTFEMNYIKMNGLSVVDLEKALLATSAIPLVYDPVELKGKRFVDGGAGRTGDNVPVKPLYEEGFKKIVVVHLKATSYIDESLYPNAKFVQIIPGKDIGNMISGTLDFTQEGIRRRMEAGYSDTMLLRDVFNVNGFID